MKPPTFLLAVALTGVSLTVPMRTIRAEANAPAVSALPPGFDGRQPQLAADAKDHALYLVVGQPQGAIFCARSADGGKTFAAPVKVGILPKLALGMRRGPRVAAEGGNVTVTAVDFQRGQVIAYRSTDRGQTWSSGVAVTSGAGDSAREGLQSLAVRPGDGLLYATWLDLRDKGTAIYGASSADHGATWSANQAVYRSPDGHVCECCHPSVSFDSSGKLAVMWRNWLGGSRDLYVSISGDGGKTFATPVKQGPGTWKINMCPMDGGAVVPLPAGGFASVWQRNKAVFFVGDGKSDAVETRVANGTQPAAAVAADGSVRLVWQDQSGALMTLTETTRAVGSATQSAPTRLAGPGSTFASLTASPLAGGVPVAAWEETGPNGSKQVFVQPLL